IEVTNADLNNVNLVAASPAKVVGNVRIEGTRRLSSNQIWVALRPAEDSAGNRWFSREESSVVTKEGTFEIKSIVTGTYYLEVTSGERDLFPKEETSGGRDLLASPLRISGGANISVEVILASNGAALDGVVRDSKDQPAKNVTVVAIPDAEHRQIRARYLKV